MPRPKVSEEARRRIAKACLHCQTTKQKCDGLSPCSLCIKRGRSEACAYSARERSYGHRRRRKAKQQPTLNDSTTSAKQGDDIPQVAVPKIARNLYDTNGRVVYLGDCAALSFLKNIQELIEGEKDPNGISCVSVIEELPPAHVDDVLAYIREDRRDLDELVDVYFTATCGILDIINRPYIDAVLTQWLDGTIPPNSGTAAVLYLVLAYGAQTRSTGLFDCHRAQSFYHHGRQIALLELTNDPSLETVQAFILISLYMLGCMRRNASFFNLGIAISAAKCLGCHRDETNAAFSAEECRLRTQLWRTLRYHDLFFCAMMGRTSSTATTDSTVVDEPSATDEPEISDQHLSLSESVRAFSIMERTIKEVYTKRRVSLGLLLRIAGEIQEASAKVPINLRTCTLSMDSRSSVIRNANVACNYYFTMMLLMRPFLITSLGAKSDPRSRLKNDDGGSLTGNSKVYADITNGAMTCIDSATYVLQLLHTSMVRGFLFRNMPLVVAWVFVSALVICSAYFGRLSSSQKIQQAMKQTDELLEFFSTHSPQARHYAAILKKLSRTARGQEFNFEHTERLAAPSMPRLFMFDLGVWEGQEKDILQETVTDMHASTLGDVELPDMDPTGDRSLSDMNDMPDIPNAGEPGYEIWEFLDFGDETTIWDLNWGGLNWGGLL